MWAPLTTYKKPLTKEEEKQEFDSIYQLLQSMVRKPTEEKPTEVDTEISYKPQEIEKIEVVETNEIIHDIQSFPLSTSTDLFDIPVTVDKTNSVRPDLILNHPTHSEKKARGRPKKIRPAVIIPSISCPCCETTFTKNSEYLLHFDTSPLCMKSHTTPYIFQPRQRITQSLQLLIHDWFMKSISTTENDTQCRHCNTMFKSLNKLYRHLSTTPICNHLAHIELKKIVSES